MMYLNVPYDQKNQAKALRARWDTESRMWYVPDGLPVAPFQRWLPKDCDAEATRAHELEAVALTAKGKTKRPVSMTESAIRAREKKCATWSATRAASRRGDDVGGKVIVGPNYAPQVGAVGLPWKV